MEWCYSPSIVKTALAVAWAHQVADQFPDGSLHVDLRGFDPAGVPLEPADVLRRFLEAAGVEPARLPATLDGLAARYRSVLAGRRVLLLLDNARDAGQVRPLLPGSGGCLVVVTSRTRLSGLVARENAQPVGLDVLDQPDAVSLLTSRLDPGRVAAEPAALAQLAERCARLPLALAVAATRAALHPQLPLSALTAELADEQSRLDVLDAGEPMTDVQAVFSWSYRQLSEPAARLFRLLGRFPGGDISAPAAAALGGAPLPAARRMLAELVRAHLLNEHAPGRFTCHDLLRAYAAGRSGAAGAGEHRPAVDRIVHWYLSTADAAGRVINPDRRRRPVGPTDQVRIEFPDHDAALHWFESERANLVAVTRLAGDQGHDAVAWQLPLAMVDFLDRRKHWTDWVASHTAGLAAADRVGDPFARAAVRNSLGVAYHELGRQDEALRYYREALEILGPTDDGYAKAMLLTNLGNINRTLKQHQDAIELHQQALALFGQIGNRYGEGLALANLGSAHAAAGQLDQALACQERSLAICRAISDRLGEAATLDNLGETLHTAGRTAEAIDRFRAALPIRREVGDRYGELVTLTNLGDVLHGIGQCEEAHACWRRAAGISEELADPGTAGLWARLDSCGCGRPGRD
jgi:tetratricopeptide (TPR) repeat protein